jgi:hypothetical protein
MDVPRYAPNYMTDYSYSKVSFPAFEPKPKPS